MGSVLLIVSEAMVEIDIKKRQKRKVIEKLLEDEYILVQVNTLANGVALPEHLMSLPSVTLKLSRLFRGTMSVNDEAIMADLLFNGAYFTCVIPLAAVWACSSARGSTQQWENSLPESLKQSSSTPPAVDVTPEPSSTEEDNSTKAATTEKSPNEGHGDKKVRPFLKRIK